MDTRDTPEQAELRRAAQRLARDLGPLTVAGLDDTARRARLLAAVRDAGWLELRNDTGAGEPLASAAEAAIVAAALARGAADTAFAGPLLAADLARRAGIAPDPTAVVAFAPALTSAATVARTVTSAPAYAVDASGASVAYLLVADGDGARLGSVVLDATSGTAGGTDLTRAVVKIREGTTVHETGREGRALARDDLDRWHALGLALTTADLVGVMRGALEVTVAYAAERKQYGVPVGSFQAVQHLLAEALTLLEGSVSVALHAAWAVDSLDAGAALQAGRVAKAYCARAAKTVCETAIQVHGGIGNTWECIVHVYLRRAVLSSQWFGDDAVQLQQLRRERLEPALGLS